MGRQFEVYKIVMAARKYSHLELLNAIINTALVLVDIGPSRPRRAKGRDITRGGLGNSVKANEHLYKVRSEISYEMGREEKL